MVYFRSAVRGPAKIQSILYPVLLVVGCLVLVCSIIGLVSRLGNREEGEEGEQGQKETKQ